MSYKRYQGEGRLLQPVTRDGERWAVRSWDTALATVSERIRAARAAHGPSAVAAVVSAQSTNEEIFLAERLVRRQLGGRLAGLSWSPADARHDDFLIDADKNPNSAGLQVLGAETSELDAVVAAARDGAVRVLVLVRADLSGPYGEALIDALSESVEFIVVLDTHFSRTAEIADVLLPIASFAETDGTVVNRARRVQRVREAIAPPVQARPGWAVLSDIARTLEGPAVPADASAVFTELAASQEPFRHLSYTRLGELGLPLESGPPS